MTIIRRRHTKNFTVIGNEVFADERLELDALGLLCYLRSRPNGWNISTEQLRRRFGCGPEKMQRLMRALIEAGWILRQETRRGGRGTFAGIEYVVLDEPDPGGSSEGDALADAPPPESEKPFAVPESGSPTPAEPESAEPESAEPESAEPESEKPTPYKELTLPNTDSLPPYPPAGGAYASESRISEREAWIGGRPERAPERRPRPGQGCRQAALPAVPPDVRAGFERLWAAYPESGRLPADRGRALALFAALSPADREAATRAAGTEARNRAQHRSQARALHRWLERGLWRNGELAFGPSAAPDPAAGRNAAGLAAALRGEWPSGCTHLVLADSAEGAAWEAHFARFGVRPRWLQLGAGLGAYLPAAAPPAGGAPPASGAPRPGSSELPRPPIRSATTPGAAKDVA